MQPVIKVSGMGKALSLLTLCLLVSFLFLFGCTQTPDKTYILKSDNNVYIDFNGFANVNYIDFNLLDGFTQQEGRLQWSSTEQTLEVGMPGGKVNLQLGQEELLRVKNSTGSLISNGSLVYICGGSGSNPTVCLADNSSIATRDAIGMTTEDIGVNKFGYVTTRGLVRELNTNSYPAGTLLWLSSSGGFTSIRPRAPLYSTVVGVVVTQNSNNGVVYVTVATVPRIVGLSDVNIIGLKNGDWLNYNSSKSLWENTSRFSSDVNIGSVSNYTNFDSNGTLTQYGEATTFDDMLSPIIVQGNTSQAPSWDSTYMMYFFHNDILNQQDFVFVQIQFSHKYKAGSPIECHVHWSPSSTNTGDVNFSLQYAWVGLGQTYSTPYTKIWAKQAGGGTAMKSQIFSFPDINANGQGFSSALVAKLMRESASTGDTFTGDAYVSFFDCHYEQDKLGTNNRYS